MTNIGGLDAKVDSVAQGWSLGQAQLMCLARAALTESAADADFVRALGMRPADA